MKLGTRLKQASTIPDDARIAPSMPGADEPALAASARPPYRRPRPTRIPPAF